MPRSWNEASATNRHSVDLGRNDVHVLSPTAIMLVRSINEMSASHNKDQHWIVEVPPPPSGLGKEVDTARNVGRFPFTGCSAIPTFLSKSQLFSSSYIFFLNHIMFNLRTRFRQPNGLAMPQHNRGLTRKNLIIFCSFVATLSFSFSEIFPWTPNYRAKATRTFCTD
jgi:hypothetical protein